MAFVYVKFLANLVDLLIPLALTSFTGILFHRAFNRIESVSRLEHLFYAYATLELLNYLYFRYLLKLFQTTTKVRPMPNPIRTALIEKIFKGYDKQSFKFYICGWFQVNGHQLGTNASDKIYTLNFKQW